MEQDKTAISIVFISDSKHAALASVDLWPVKAYVDQDDKQGIEDVITFLTQYASPQ